MNQAGKHATADHGRVENKRERRRGAAGRAAVLRRAPSDSDCSGETASLSADSGDRAARPVPLAPPRSGKTRSRRRGSEWEVLEGLKDGQRFEKRPDVFNGYLHKKRKWPLKGWHKRFFVVDGGILVYARSPTDVARGRLHGSVDVGLSVISAKARRRRIDIDADEFIYHLRAKTPELFRTWLNVLKVHRLYRQHLLTFGARESVPKIHAPLEDHPATDTSSHVSLSDSTETSIDHTDHDLLDVLSLDRLAHVFKSSLYSCKVDNSMLKWQRAVESKKSFLSLKMKNSEQKFYENQTAVHMPHNSICSMKCMTTRFVDEIKNQSPDFSLNSMIVEKQMTSTDLERSCNDTRKLLDHSVIDLVKRHNASKTHESNDSPTLKRCAKISYKQSPKRKTTFLNTNKKLMTTCFYFARHKHRVSNYSEPLMKRSKKCTNLVKHRNITEESPLKILSSKYTLLKKYKLSASKTDANKNARHRGVACDSILRKNNEVQVKMDVKEHKSSQVASTKADYDKITEKLMISIFRQNSGDAENDTKYNIDQVVRQLYDIKADQQLDPVKALFRNLLEYWLKNTSVSEFKEAMTGEKSVDRQSNKHFSKDEKLSSCGCVDMKTIHTQFHGVSDMEVHYKVHNSANNAKQKDTKYEKVNEVQVGPIRGTESFEKERRIQELERLLKNTVYVCETARNNVFDTSHHNFKKKDIKITKTLMNNLGKTKHEMAPIENKVILKSSSSTELPDIQDTINHLISETAIPPDVAKEFLGAYLDVLLQDSNKSKSTTTSQFSDWDESSKSSKEIPGCNVATESVLKKVSKSVSTSNKRDNAVASNRNSNTDKQMDAGQFYLKDVLDKVTTIFSKVSKFHGGSRDTKQKEEPQSTKKPTTNESVKPVFKFSKKDLVYENCNDNCLVIDLSKYKLEYLTMFNDPASEGVISVTVKLREKSVALNETAKSNMSMSTSSSDKPILPDLNRSDNWLSFINVDDSISNNIFTKLPIDPNKITYLGFEDNRHSIEVRPYSSSSNGTSKAYCPFKESKTSLDMACTSNRNVKKEVMQRQKPSGEMHSCYVMSIKKGSLAAAFQCKKKSRESNEVNSCEACYSKTADTNKVEEPSLFEKPAPRVIDEKFILLLLENLVLLSKNVPTLYKELNILYVKLKKKHEKVVKTCNHIQGLSLLGRIYSEDLSFKDGDDKGTQYELDNEYIEENTKAIHIACANKDNNLKYISNGATTDSSVQTDEHSLPNNFYNKDLPTKVNHPRKHKVDFQTETAEIQLLERSTFNVNNKTHRDTLNTIKRHILEDIRKVPVIFAKPIIDRDIKTMITSPHVRENVAEEMSLKPKILVSVQSQTEKQLVQMDWHEEMDLKVYQLLSVNKSRLKPSSSITLADSNAPEYADDLKTLYRCCSDPSFCSGLLSPTTPTLRGPQAGFVSGTPGGRLAGWIIESGGPLESASRELGQAQLSVQQLQRLLDALELQQQVHHDTDVSLEGASPNVKKDRRKFGLRKKKSNSKCASVELAPPHIDPSSSHTALSSLSALTAPPSPGGGASSMPNSAASLPIACAAARPQSLPGAESLNTAPGPASLTSLTPDHQLREDFTVLAKDLVASLKGIVSGLVCERGRLRAAMEAAESTATPASGVVAALRTNLTSALQQNSELRSKMSRIHDTSDIAEILSLANSEAMNRQFQQSLSYSSSCVSASEFFDAEEHEDDDLKPDGVIVPDEAGVIELDGDSSSEAGSLSSEEGSASSDNSDGAMVSAEQLTLRSESGPWSRRTRLPAARPSPGGPSLWNLLYKNIGKDLSQISMPVTINEPLNMLQRLCEELEYSELLDSAAECTSSIERMCLISAFAVSAYAASAHRAASKPFNPLLGESYECLREDRGFRFIAEQVSHHPPISACHAESSQWCFWQEARIKTKFWGKSMEFQPTGRVHVRLKTTGDHYVWNKVTTCVHNLFGGQRWVDQYGDMHITCVGTDISCKLNFIKASSWSHTRHEVRGSITSGTGARVRLAGRWSEALHAGEPPGARCLWRPGAMPPEHEMYYGFTRFAMELNEMEPGMRDLLPQTDTRFRPDQRALEEGDVDSAESYKLSLEQAQRERRRESPNHTPAWFCKTVEDGEETWQFTGEYWKVRETGFSDLLPRIW